MRSAIDQRHTHTATQSRTHTQVHKDSHRLTQTDTHRYVRARAAHTHQVIECGDLVFSPDHDVVRVEILWTGMS